MQDIKESELKEDLKQLAQVVEKLGNDVFVVLEEQKEKLDQNEHFVEVKETVKSKLRAFFTKIESFRGVLNPDRLNALRNAKKPDFTFEWLDEQVEKEYEMRDNAGFTIDV